MAIPLAEEPATQKLLTIDTDSIFEVDLKDIRHPLSPPAMNKFERPFYRTEKIDATLYTNVICKGHPVAKKNEYYFLHYCETLRKKDRKKRSHEWVLHNLVENLK